MDIVFNIDSKIVKNVEELVYIIIYVYMLIYVKI